MHGDKRGSVDPAHNAYRTPFIDPNPGRRDLDRRQVKHSPALLDAQRRAVVHRTILEVVEHRGWTLHALNVRTNHVHVVIGACDAPERILNALKSWSTRRMVEAGVLERGIKAWARHGSTRYLCKSVQVDAACRYVADGQGADLPAER